MAGELIALNYINDCMVNVGKIRTDCKLEALLRGVKLRQYLAFTVYISGLLQFIPYQIRPFLADLDLFPVNNMNKF